MSIIFLEVIILFLCFLQLFIKNMKILILFLLLISLLSGMWLSEMNAAIFGILISIMSVFYCMAGLFMVISIGQKEEKHDSVRLIASVAAALLFVLTIGFYGNLFLVNEFNYGAIKSTFNLLAFSRSLFEGYLVELVASVFLFFILIFGASYIFSLQNKRG
jgi:hypothetical protein